MLLVITLRAKKVFARFARKASCWLIHSEHSPFLVLLFSKNFTAKAYLHPPTYAMALVGKSLKLWMVNR
jgi:hypothetical protein